MTSPSPALRPLLHCLPSVLSQDGKTGLLGLLGSDTLSRFQVIHVDYKNQRLVFHPGPSGRLEARP